MKTRIALYESYGFLAHEKSPIYSEHLPATGYYGHINVLIGDEYPLSKNSAGETLIDIDGRTFLLSQVLGSFGGKPCLAWYDGSKHHRVFLDIVH